MSKDVLVKGLVFDVDGTLALRDRSGGYSPLPGAADSIKKVRSLGLPYLVFTNGTGRLAADQAAGLCKVGIEVEPDLYITPSHVAADFFKSRGMTRVLGIGVPAAMQPLLDLGVTVESPNTDFEAVDAVYIGSVSQFSVSDIESVSKQLKRGVGLYVSTDVRHFAGQGTPLVNFSGAVVAAIEYICGVRAEVLGKPSRYAMDYAARRLGVAIEDLAVIGDDPFLEVKMARDFGAYSVGVTSGIADFESYQRKEVLSQPHLLKSNLVGLLDELPLHKL